jgi:hypothetical protein
MLKCEVENLEKETYSFICLFMHMRYSAIMFIFNLPCN